MTRRLQSFPAVALVAMLIVVVGPSSVGAAPRTVVPSCSAIITKSELIKAMGVAAVLRTVPMSGSKFSPWGDGPGGLRGGNIVHTACSYDWSYSTPGSVPAGDPDPDTTSTQFLAPNTFVIVGANVTAQEWHYIKTSEAQSPGATDACSGCSYAPQQPLTLASGTQGFIESFAVPAPVTTPPSPDATCYSLYVWTSHHDLVEISAWPAPLAAQEALIVGALQRFPKF
jgi:hypothetical protein